MLELAQELNDRGHSVTVITTWPEYNLDESAESKTFQEIENEDGIKVIRVKTLPHHNVNYIVRGISQLFMPVQFLFKLRKYKISPDAVVVYSPPLPLALVGSWLRRKGSRYLLNIQDLFPQNAIDLKVLINPLQIRFFKKLERYAYKSADIVTVHSEGNRNMLVKQQPNIASKLKILHNWVDIDHHQVDEEKINFRKKWGITHEYIAVFAGVMGPSQYLELVLKVAENVKNKFNLLFLFVGDGVEKDKLKKIAESRNLDNVQFEDFISRDRYPNLLNNCDIGLVCLSPQNKTPVVPGKILGYMAVGIPTLAYLHKESDGHQLISDANCGTSALSSDVDACISALEILMTKKDEFHQLGQSGKHFAINNFSKNKCVDVLESFLINKK